MDHDHPRVVAGCVENFFQTVSLGFPHAATGHEGRRRDGAVDSDKCETALCPTVRERRVSPALHPVRPVGTGLSPGLADHGIVVARNDQTGAGQGCEPGFCICKFCGQTEIGEIAGIEDQIRPVLSNILPYRIGKRREMMMNAVTLPGSDAEARLFRKCRHEGKGEGRARCTSERWARTTGAVSVRVIYLSLPYGKLGDLMGKIQK